MMQEKLKLLFVITQLYNGGAERATVNLLKKLDSAHYEVDFIVLNQIPQVGAQSLIPEIPSWVNVCNVYYLIQGMNWREKKRAYLLYKQEELSAYSYPALEFVRRKEYDWAFHVGEWGDPAFIALKVTSRHKALWIHTDLSLAGDFNPDLYFCYLEQFDRCIFVSQKALERSCGAYPYLKRKSVVIHNFIDNEAILMKAKVKSSRKVPDRPVIVTVANVRQEKGHLRQIEAMHILKKEGLDFEWWNIGSLANRPLVNVLEEKIREYGLENDYLLLGASENPYSYMCQGTAVACMSDYESWSMVISEAKVLEIPVIATRTAGAIEQIEDGISGVLTGFSPEEIAERIKEILFDVALQTRIKDHLRELNLHNYALAQFENMITSKDTSATDSGLLLVVDNILFNGGAHIATKNQIGILSKNEITVHVFSLCRPTDRVRKELPNTMFYSWESIPKNRLFNQKLLNCIKDPKLDKKNKHFKVEMSLFSRLHPKINTFDQYVLPSLAEFFSKFQTVCVTSEGSVLKRWVANCSAHKKIQWIHTDYCMWRKSSEWAQNLSKDDRVLWQKFDKIVVLSPKFQNQMSTEFPELANKICVLPNIMPVEEIRIKAHIPIKKKCFVNFVTVARFEPVKGIPRLLNVLGRLVGEGYKFRWVFVGEGEELNACKNLVNQLGINEFVVFVGNQSNPYQYILDADVFVLASYYEGLPNTIYEAFILGVPVCASDVGGISDQVISGENGWLAENSEDGIYEALAHIMCSPEEIAKYKENLKYYTYDNTSVSEGLVSLFSAS